MRPATAVLRDFRAIYLHISMTNFVRLNKNGRQKKITPCMFSEISNLGCLTFVQIPNFIIKLSRVQHKFSYYDC